VIFNWQFWRQLKTDILFLGWKKWILCWNIFIFLKFFANLQEKKFEFFFHPHLDPDFSLVAFLKPVFQLFRQVLKFCHHLMLSPSWDANQWHNIRKLRKVQLLLMMINQGAQKLAQSLQIGNPMCHFVIFYVHFLRVWVVVSLKKLISSLILASYTYSHHTWIQTKTVNCLNLRFLYMDFVTVIWKFVRLWSWSLRCRHMWFEEYICPPSTWLDHSSLLKSWSREDLKTSLCGVKSESLWLKDLNWYPVSWNGTWFHSL
jgi:hypothetical protein